MQNNSFPGFGVAPQQHKTQHIPSNTKGGIVGIVTSLKFIAFLILVLQVVILVFMYFSTNIYQYTLNQQIINEVAKQTSVNPSETPVIGVLTDVNTLRKDNPYQAEVYKDAQNGDYVVGYTQKMIIYRRKENKIIYDGDSPVTLQNKLEQNLILSIVSKAKEQAIIDSNSDEVPQVSQITDLTQVQAQDPVFYADAQVGDAIALFPKVKKVVLYRPSSNTVIKTGAYNFQIQ